MEGMKSFHFKDKTIRVGIGVNTGPTMIGIIGEHWRLSCDVISAAVNMASRIESLTKYYGCSIIVSEATHSRCSEMLSRELDKVLVVGIATPVRIFEVLGYKSNATSKQKDIVEGYELARKMYNNREFVQAMERFHTLKGEGDKPSAVMHERCIEFAKYPPPDNWEEVWVFKNK